MGKRETGEKGERELEKVDVRESVCVCEARERVCVREIQERRENVRERQERVCERDRECA